MFFEIAEPSSTQAVVSLPSNAAGRASSATLTVAKANRHSAARASKKLEDAVYTYIRAIRRLGHTQLDTAQIADALNQNVREINAAVARLSSKGVKILG